MVKQGELTSEEGFAPGVRRERVATSRLAPLCEKAPKPDDRFLASTGGALGIVQPIVLMDTERGGYCVLDGRRRILAAVHHGIPDMDAVIYPAGWVQADVATLSMNALRSDNILAEIDAIRRLGDDPEADAKLLSAGITKQRRQMLMKLASDQRLLDAYANGLIARTGIEDALKLPTDSLEALVARLEAGEAVKGTEIREMRRTHRATAWNVVQMNLELQPAIKEELSVDRESARQEYLTTCQTVEGQAAWARKYGMLLLEG